MPPSPSGALTPDGCTCPSSSTRTGTRTQVHCMYCRARVGYHPGRFSALDRSSRSRRGGHDAPTRPKHLCYFFEAYFAAPSKRAADRILARDAARRNGGIYQKERPLPSLAESYAMGYGSPVERAAFAAKLEAEAEAEARRKWTFLPPPTPQELEEIERRREAEEFVKWRARKAFAPPVAKPTDAEPYRPWRNPKRPGKWSHVLMRPY